MCSHLWVHTYEDDKHLYIAWSSFTFTCRCFQSLTARRTGLSSSNEKHVCSRRLNLLQAHLLLAKHFHPHLNLSVSFLSASSVSMCVLPEWMCVCVCVWVCVRVCVSECWYDIYSTRYAPKSYRPFLFSLPHPVSSLSSPYPFCLSISLLILSLPVERQTSTLRASSNGDTDVNRPGLKNQVIWWSVHFLNHRKTHTTVKQLCW